MNWYYFVSGILCLLIGIKLLAVYRKRFKNFKANPPKPPKPTIIDISMFKGRVVKDEEIEINNPTFIIDPLGNSTLDARKKIFTEELSLAEPQDYLIYGDSIFSNQEIHLWRRDPKDLQTYYHSFVEFSHFDGFGFDSHISYNHETKQIIKKYQARLNITSQGFFFGDNSVFIFITLCLLAIGIVLTSLGVGL